MSSYRTYASTMEAFQSFLREISQSKRSGIEILPGVESTASLDFDPIGNQFGSSLERIASTSRLRKRPVRCPSSCTLHGVVRTSTITHQDAPFPQVPPVYVTEESSQLLNVSTAASKDSIKDTTRRTRLPDQSQGECEHSVFKPCFAPRTTVHPYTDSIVYSYPALIVKRADKEESCGISGYCSGLDIEALRVNELDHAYAMLAQHGPTFLAKALPTSRQFGLFRSLVELRDFPRSVRTKLALLQGSKIWNRPIRQLSNQYLDNEFGWKPLISDIQAMLSLPSQIEKRLLYLQKNCERALTGRYRATWLEDGPSIVHTFPSTRAVVGVQENNVRELAFTATLSCYLKFPNVYKGSPGISQWVNLSGLNPTLADIYRLTPWTWLIDWFADLGNYLDVIVAFNSDQTLVNWGMVSVKSTVSIRTTAALRMRCSYVRLYNGYGVNLLYNEDIPVSAESTLVTYIRQNASNVAKANLRFVSELKGLSFWQTSIIAALLGHRLL